MIERTPASTLIVLLQGLKYLAAVIVAMLVPSFALVAFSFLAFGDHDSAIACFLRLGMTVGVALAQIFTLAKAWTLLKQRQRLRLSGGLMILSIVPAPIAIVLYMRIPS